MFATRLVYSYFSYKDITIIFDFPEGELPLYTLRRSEAGNKFYFFGHFGVIFE